jgi:hypothetical protein
MCPLIDAARAGDNPPFSVSIRPRQDAVMAGHEVYLDIVLTNTSGKTVTIKLWPSEYVFVLDVREPDGQPATMTDNGRNITKNAVEEMKPAPPGAPDTRGYLSVTLLPGQAYKDGIKVDDIYSMWTQGIYSLKVRRLIPDDLGKGEVESNTVNVTITYNPTIELLRRGPK